VGRGLARNCYLGHPAMGLRGGDRNARQWRHAAGTEAAQRPWPIRARGSNGSAWCWFPGRHQRNRRWSTSWANSD
jgi:hypothetical protein